MVEMGDDMNCLVGLIGVRLGHDEMMGLLLMSNGAGEKAGSYSCLELSGNNSLGMGEKCVGAFFAIKTS